MPKILQPDIISQPGHFSACIKAFVPLIRERLLCEKVQSGQRFKHGDQVPLREKLIFGALTSDQLGYVSNISVNFNEEEDIICQDTYVIKTMDPVDSTVKVDVQKELFKINVVNEYELDELDLTDRKVQIGCSLEEIQTFYEWLILDLYRREAPVCFQAKKPEEKKYLIVPLRLQPCAQNELAYKLDVKLIKKVCQLKLNGYKAQQPNILKWLEQKQLGYQQEEELLRKWMVVKQDKPNSCYHFDNLQRDLETKSAQEFLIAIRSGKGEDMGGTAYDLLWQTDNRFKSIMSFRQIVNSLPDQDYAQQIRNSPIALLDPIKPIYGHKYSYSLNELSKHPNAKQEYKKKHKELNNISTSQGRPIFSAVDIYRHYLKTLEWRRAQQLPAVCAFFERSLYCSQLTAELGYFIHPEFILWSTSAKGLHTTKKCYETLETYGDTILKLAATHLAYDKLQYDLRADEKQINDLKTSFITNLYLFKIGKKLELRRYMRNRDPDIKEWRPPYSTGSKIVELISCTGKNIADGVESLLGALFLSSNLYTTLKFISDVQIVPFEQAKLLPVYNDVDYTFKLGPNLDAYGFDIEDSVSSIYRKYFAFHNAQSGSSSLFIDQKETNHIYLDVLKLDQKPSQVASKFDQSELKLKMGELSSYDRSMGLKELICQDVEKILGYKFANRNLLIHALTHRSFKDAYNLEDCYEKLEVLGDAILDYLANQNLIKYTMFEKYNVQERRAQKYITQEDFLPFDAHQAKSLLTKNEFLAKLVCLFGFQAYILYDKKKPSSHIEISQEMPEWQKQKLEQQWAKEAEIDCFIAYSFKKDFKINNRDLDLYEPSKILGDVFEALIGAIFVDGQMEAVIQVYEHMLAPFILHVAKYSKRLNKEPKEDFQILSGLHNIRPNIKDAVPVEIQLNETQMLQGQAGLLDALRQNQLVTADVQSDKSDKQIERGGVRVKLFEVVVVYNFGDIMCKGYGNTKKQAERNASINGLNWMRKEGILGEQDVSCSGRAVNQNLGGFQAMRYDESMEESKE